MVLVTRPPSEINRKILKSRVYRFAIYIIAKKDIGYNILEDQISADTFYANHGATDVETLLDYAKITSKDENIIKI